MSDTNIRVIKEVIKRLIISHFDNTDCSLEYLFPSF